MGFTIGGLSTGMDTGAIIDQLMAIERQPVVKLEAQKKTQTARLDAAKAFNTKLTALRGKIDAMATSRDLVARSATTSSDSSVAATATSTAAPGSFEVKVLNLAQTEKRVYLGVADKDTTTFGTGTLAITNDALTAPVSIDIDGTNNTLEGLRDAINAKSTEHGVSASIVNDGSGSPYRLVLSGVAVANGNISLDTTGLSGGAAMPAEDAAVSRSATPARVVVDGILVLSQSNTLTEAIPGVSLNLKAADLTTPLGANPTQGEIDAAKAAAKSTTLTVANDESKIKEKVGDFVTAFNDLVKSAGHADLAGDNGIRSILSSIRSQFTSSGSGTGMFQLGIFTQKDGTLELKADKLAEAIKSDLSGVEQLLVGTTASPGVAARLKTSVASLTNAVTGFMASRQSSYDSIQRRIDRDIERNEKALEYKEQRLVAQFAALEQLVSGMNSQGAYLTQQMNALNNG